MPKPYPQELRDDVVRVVCNCEPGQAIKQIAADFGIAESCVRNWIRQADDEDGAKPVTGAPEYAELREAKKCIRLLDQENEVVRRAAASRYPDLLLFLAYTGLRWGEATGLKVKHVDATRRRVAVEENAVIVNGHVQVGTPKTHERRAVPYPSSSTTRSHGRASGRIRRQSSGMRKGVVTSDRATPNPAGSQEPSSEFVPKTQKQPLRRRRAKSRSRRSCPA